MSNTYKLLSKECKGFPGSSVIKESACNAEDVGSIPGSGKPQPGEGNGNPLPLFLTGKSQGQRSQTGYSPWGRKRGHDLATKQQSRQRISLLSLFLRLTGNM